MPDSENPLLSPSPDAWESLIASVEPAVILVLIDQRMSAPLRALHSAEDVLQEALLQAWRSRDSYEWRGIKSFRAWLLTIIDHRIHDLVDRSRAAKRSAGGPVVHFSALEKGDSKASAEPGFPAASTTPSRLAMYREQADAMHAALERLPDDVREVVRLRLFDQCPLDEIATRLGLGVEGVRHRFRKGSEMYVESLQAALGSHTPDSHPRPPRKTSSKEEPRL